MSSIPLHRDAASEAYFAALDAGTLVLQRCPACGHHQFPLPFHAAVACCRRCGAAPDWVPAAGSGRLVSWTIVHGRDSTQLAGIVALAEGPWVHAALDAEHPAVGLPLVADVDRRHADAEPRLVFRPARAR